MMTPSEVHTIQPADVYAQVMDMLREIAVGLALIRTLIWMVGALCLLVVIQILSKYVIFGRIMELLREVRALLTLTESHGRQTDRSAKAVELAVRPLTEQAPVLAAAATAATKEIVERVERIPGQVVEEIEKKKNSDSFHG